MQSPFGHYLLIARRWAWLVILGVVICSVSVYTVSKLMRPVYQATAILYINFHSASPYENTNAAMSVLPTYAQFITNPTILEPVVVQHKGLTVSDLAGMVQVKPVSSTQNIEVDVQNSDPKLATQLANEVSQSFAQYSNTQLSATVQIFPAVFPTDPIRPNPKSNALLGALVGLGLSLALIVIFEWADNRCTSLEQIQEILEADCLASIPKLPGKASKRTAEKHPALAEASRLLGASVSAYQVRNPFKLLMVTSATADEGKTTIAANLASFLSQAGKRVLLVDADLRRSALKKYFQLDDYRGLSNVFFELSSEIEMELDGQSTDIPGLRVMTAGVPIYNPAEVMQSSLATKLFDRFKALSQFDYIIFDTPPLLPVADAQILASYVPVTVLVVDASKTLPATLIRVKRVLSRTGTAILGLVINKSEWLEDGAVRQYLSDIEHRQPKKRPYSMSLLPDTPVELSDKVSRVEDEEDQTLTLPRDKSKSTAGE